MTEPDVIFSDDGSVLLVHPDYQEKVGPRWFDPAFWGKQAIPVSSGGRGNAWFVRLDSEPSLVLRWYQRGGLVARLSRFSYVYTGLQRARAFTEFRILFRLFEQGFPVPRPIAARVQHHRGVLYQGGIITQQIEGAVPLADRINRLSPDNWRHLGTVIRKFHDACVFHADLNCFNILLQGEQFFLIDFDKGRIMPATGSGHWQRANLKRLLRSLEKIADRAAVSRVWVWLLEGYQRSKPL